MDEVGRTRLGRAAAEAALVRVVHHYGERPGFVVLGGLLPELLCSESPFAHAGTTDVDVQVNLEIAAGAVNASRLERALRNAEFEPDTERAWRWVAEGLGAEVVVRFELLADLDDVAEGATLTFDGCEALGAANLRGTGYAVRDVGGPEAAAAAVLECIEDDLAGRTRTAVKDLRGNFADPKVQGPTAYADQMLLDHPELDRTTLLADAVVAVDRFCGMVLR